MVEAEVVLERDRRVRLRRRLHLDRLLGLDGLVESVGVAAAREHAARVLVDDHHLAVLHDVFDVLFVERVGAQELLDGVEALGAFGVAGVERALGLLGAARRRHRQVGVLSAVLAVLVIVGGRGGVFGAGLGVDEGDLLADVGEDEQVAVVAGAAGGEVDAALGHLDRVLLLVEREEQRLVDLRHVLRVVLQVVELGLLQQRADARLLEQLGELLRARVAARDAQDGEARLFLDARGLLLLARGQERVALLELALGLRAEGGDDLLLFEKQALDDRLELPEGGVVGLRHRAGDDERRPRLVDEHRVHFVDDAEVVVALDELLGVEDERVVAQVVEAELVVRAVGDVGGVGGAARGAVRLVAVDHVDGEAVELEDRRHPLGVAPREVRVDGDDVHAAPGEGVEVDRRDADERLALARLHLGDAALVERDAAEQLHVVGHHVPVDRRAAGLPALADHAAAGLLDDGEGLGQDFVEHLVDGGEPLGVEVVDFLDDLGAVFGGQRRVGGLPVTADGGARGALEAQAQGLAFGLDVGDALGDGGLEGGRLAAQLVVGEALQGLVGGVDVVDDRTEGFEDAALAVAEELLEEVEHCRGGAGKASGGRPGGGRAGRNGGGGRKRARRGCGGEGCRGGVRRAGAWRRREGSRT